MMPAAVLAAHRREISIAITILVFAAVLAAVAPGFFAPENLVDLALANMPVLIAAPRRDACRAHRPDRHLGRLDVRDRRRRRRRAVSPGAPLPLVAAGACLIGLAIGALNGALVAYARIPSIVATLATMVALRDGLRWITQGAWVSDLPDSFQWLGLSQRAYLWLAAAVAAALVGGIGWACVICPPDWHSMPPAPIATPRASPASTPIGSRLPRSPCSAR